MQSSDRQPDAGLQLPLARNPMFAGLGPDVLRSFLEAWRLRRYRTGALVFMQGDPADEVFCVAEGRVTIFSTTVQGGSQLYAFVGPGEIFGELGVLGNMPRSATAESLEDCSIWSVSGGVFLKFISEQSLVARAFLEALARHVVELNVVTEDVLFLDLKGRVAKRLLGLMEELAVVASPDGIVLPLQINQTQLAALCGGSRENVSRVLSEFQRRGMIKRIGHSYVLRDVMALRRLARLQ
ncbi:MAG: Crp/Fnr family transcriptional regulator [Egibacteraceae bacterium]